MSTSWISKNPLTVLLENEFNKYYEVTVNRESLYVLLGTVTTTVKVQSSMKEASQICLKSPQARLCEVRIIFIIVHDWAMKSTVEKERNGIRWDFKTVLKDLIFADDIVLISSTWSHMQRKTSILERNATYVGLK